MTTPDTRYISIYLYTSEFPQAGTVFLSRFSVISCAPYERKFLGLRTASCLSRYANEHAKEAGNETAGETSLRVSFVDLCFIFSSSCFARFLPVDLIALHACSNARELGRTAGNPISSPEFLRLFVSGWSPGVCVCVCVCVCVYVCIFLCRGYVTPMRLKLLY